MCLFCRTQRKIFWRMWETEQLWGTIDFHSTCVSYYGAPKQPDYKLSSEYLPLRSEQPHSYRFWTTWGWVNDERIYIFGWTVSLNMQCVDLAVEVANCNQRLYCIYIGLLLYCISRSSWILHCAPSVTVVCALTGCCPSAVSTRVAVTCRPPLDSVSAEKTTLHKDCSNASNTLSSVRLCRRQRNASTLDKYLTRVILLVHAETLVPNTLI